MIASWMTKWPELVLIVWIVKDKVQYHYAAMIQTDDLWILSRALYHWTALQQYNGG